MIISSEMTEIIPQLPMRLLAQCCGVPNFSVGGLKKQVAGTSMEHECAAYTCVNAGWTADVELALNNPSAAFRKGAT